MYALPTVEIVCETMGLPIASIETEQSIYESSKSDLFLVLSDTPSLIKRLSLVRHNPSFVYLVYNLAPKIPPAKKGNLMLTAALAYFQLDLRWSTLVGDYWIQRPKDIHQ